MKDLRTIIEAGEHKKAFLCMVFRVRCTLNGKDDWHYAIFRKQRRAWDEVRVLGETLWIKPQPPLHYGCLVLNGQIPAQKLIDTLLGFFPTVFFENSQTNFVEVQRSKTVLHKHSLEGVLKDLQIIAARLYCVGTDLSPTRILQDNIFDPTVFSAFHRDLGYQYEEWVRMKKAHQFIIDSVTVNGAVARELGRPIDWLIAGGMKGMAGNYLKAVGHVRNEFHKPKTHASS